MINVFLSINNREQVLQLPVVPESFGIVSPLNHETFTTISQGEIKLIGLRGLKSISLESYFPVRDYPFLRDRTYRGFEYVRLLDSWIARKIPMRLTITDTPINMPVVVDSFEYGVGKSGDVDYKLALSEFRFIKVKGV
ncbi:hypothetical protein [Cohnella cholangitidis]|uniref:Phage portal protein n=1 Tax=Cohnella cholangitidis TaxID=2598458 RepID=A0A7G5C3G1_9BACL|nr:hypothetical protein [Cohnella cholangitidis]QMV43745.1 hypothetical protein FPL14_23155 [Cohnella cholangitidis]